MTLVTLTLSRHSPHHTQQSPYIISQVSAAYERTDGRTYLLTYGLRLSLTHRHTSPRGLRRRRRRRRHRRESPVLLNSISPSAASSHCEIIGEGGANVSSRRRRRGRRRRPCPRRRSSPISQSFRQTVTL